MEDEEISLSASTLAALKEFMSEEQERKQKFAELQAQAEEQFQNNSVGIDEFKEDWGLSQFWYSDETANLLADELLDGADEDTRVVVISAPSVYAAIKKRPAESLPTQHIYLLEYDDRFAILAGKNFVHYDFNSPLNVPKELANTFDRALVDPPFLSEDCQTKASITARYLTKKERDAKSKNGTLQYRTIVCTGERMSQIIAKVYPDTKVTTFRPEHKNGLSNEFRCYASYEGSRWKWE